MVFSETEDLAISDTGLWSPRSNSITSETNARVNRVDGRRRFFTICQIGKPIKTGCSATWRYIPAQRQPTFQSRTGSLTVGSLQTTQAFALLPRRWTGGGAIIRIWGISGCFPSGLDNESPSCPGTTTTGASFNGGQ